MYEFLRTLDRRWIFLLMFLAVSIPILLQARFPEKPTGLAQAVFDEIDNLPDGSKILLAFDYDPASEGELGPMATSFVVHCAEKRHQMYFVALWPVGPQMIEDNINGVIRQHYPHLVYGEDYVNLGFKTGNEGVIKLLVNDLPRLFPTDRAGTPIGQIPMMRGIANILDMDLIANVSAGYPGTKEWIQYAVTPHPDRIRIVAGCTGVQAPLMYPYIPRQLPGLLGAIKGAAEYENLVMQKYGESLMVETLTGERILPGKFLEAQRRMGPQLVAHILMVLLILLGNTVFFISRRREMQR